MGAWVCFRFGSFPRHSWSRRKASECLLITVTAEDRATTTLTQTHLVRGSFDLHRHYEVGITDGLNKKMNALVHKPNFKTFNQVKPSGPFRIHNKQQNLTMQMTVTYSSLKQWMSYTSGTNPGSLKSGSADKL